MTANRQVYTMPDGTKTTPLSDPEALAMGFCPFCLEFQFGFLADNLRTFGACDSCCMDAEPDMIEEPQQYWWSAL